eukprot:741264-Alexandrium_andersonii.AAC.1
MAARTQAEAGGAARAGFCSDWLPLRTCSPGVHAGCELVLPKARCKSKAWGDPSPRAAGRG